MSRTFARRLWLLISEGALIYLCGVLAICLRFTDAAQEMLLHRQGGLKILFAVFVVQSSFYLFELYDFRLIKRRSVLFLRLLQALGVAAITMAIVFYLLPQMMLGRGVFVLSLVLMLALMIGWRLLAGWVLHHPRLVERVLILGTGQNAIELAREMLARREEGYEVIGFVGDEPQLVGQSLINPCVVGVMSDLESIAHRFHTDRIVVALDERRGRLPLDCLLQLKLRDDMAVEEAASFYERLTGRINTERLHPGQLIFTDDTWLKRLYRRWHRLADVLLACSGLTLALPIMTLTAIAIRLDSGGSIFYTQPRVGTHNSVFSIIKFRSMRADAETNGPIWADAADARVTRVGRFIRRTRIDELPQFINVLRGEMSFIGPRPERPVFVTQLEHEILHYSQRHLIRPGLTGWAQVCYPYGASVEDAQEKLKYDLYYIKNQSPWLDALILLKTARIVLFGRLAR
jgi:sugar transferase (PEP-CTERM system associated)